MKPYAYEVTNELGEQELIYAQAVTADDLNRDHVELFVVSDALTYPKDLTDDLREVLGWPCFKCAPIAHAMRAGGDNIKPKAEDEQAVVLHWLVTLVLTHGALGWRAEAQKEIVRLRDAAIAKEKQS